MRYSYYSFSNNFYSFMKVIVELCSCMSNVYAWMIEHLSYKYVKVIYYYTTFFLIILKILMNIFICSLQDYVTSLSSLYWQYSYFPVLTKIFFMVIELIMIVNPCEGAWCRYSLAWYWFHFLILLIVKWCSHLVDIPVLAPAVTVGETEGAMDSASVFFLPLLLPITL